MKSTIIPTILATLALGGVITLAFQSPEPASRTDRAPRSDDSAARELEELKRTIATLQRRVRELETASRSSAILVESRATNDTPRDASKDPSADAEQRGETRRRNASSSRLGRLIDAGEVAAMTTEQQTQVDEAVRVARTSTLEAMRVIRRDPANEGLEREQIVELVKERLTTLRADLVRELTAIVPAADAEVIAQKLMTARSGDRRNRRRRAR